MLLYYIPCVTLRGWTGLNAGLHGRDKSVEIIGSLRTGTDDAHIAAYHID